MATVPINNSTEINNNNTKVAYINNTEYNSISHTHRSRCDDDNKDNDKVEKEENKMIVIRMRMKMIKNDLDEWWW